MSFKFCIARCPENRNSGFRRQQRLLRSVPMRLWSWNVALGCRVPREQQIHCPLGPHEPLPQSRLAFTPGHASHLWYHAYFWSFQKGRSTRGQSPSPFPSKLTIGAISRPFYHSCSCERAFSMSLLTPSVPVGSELVLFHVDHLWRSRDHGRHVDARA